MRLILRYLRIQIKIKIMKEQLIRLLNEIDIKVFKNILGMKN